ncbi:hypothetical protein Lser_V15G44322 [Lactuca serriola]
MVRIVKGESSGSDSKVNDASRRDRGESDHNEGDDQNEGNGLERRVLRSRYLAVKNLISDKRDDITKADSEKFRFIFYEVECLHQLVQKPREQVADAEALLDITNTLMTSVKAHSNEGVTPSDFVSCILKNFGRIGSGSDGVDEIRNSVRWKDIGIAVSHVFSRLMDVVQLGPMNSKIKQRKYGEALSRLNVVIRHHNVLHPENVIAYDDAVSALGKICHFHCNSIELAQDILLRLKLSMSYFVQWLKDLHT